MNRKLGARLLLVFGGLILALGIGELLVRVFWDDLRPLRDVQIDYTMDFPAPITGLPFGFIPGSEFAGKYDGDPYGTLPEDLTIHYRINESGFRDRPLSERDPRGTHRIMVVGDSFAFGEGVAVADRSTEVMDAGLDERIDGGVDTFNCAVSGYASSDHSALVRFMLPRLEPDLVLLAYCLNDPIHLTDDDYPTTDLIMLRGQGEVGEAGSYLWRFLRQRLGARRMTGKTLDWYRSLYEGPKSPWVRSRIHLAEMRDAAKKGGARFAVAIQPIFSKVGGDYPLAGAHREVVRWCENNRIPVLDLQPAFKGLSSKELIVHPRDHHPNAKAHRIMGQELAGFVTEVMSPR